MLLSLLVALVIGYACFRFRIIGHYFALVTLALSEVVRLVIIALRDYTGGSLGITPKPGLVDGATASLYAMQFSDRTVWFYIALAVWLLGLVLWKLADDHPSRRALQAISEDEDAAASIGIPVARTKLGVTLLSAGMTAFGGVLYAQYQFYVNPDTVSGIAISLQMVFGAIAGGMFVRLGPTVGRDVPAGAVGDAAGADRQRAPRRRHDGLRCAADPVHHLHAEGDPGDHPAAARMMPARYSSGSFGCAGSSLGAAARALHPHVHVNGPSRPGEEQ